MSYWFQKCIQLPGHKQGCYLIHEELMNALGDELSNIDMGLCNIFLPHTSAGICLGENSDPTVRTDMNNFLTKLVPEGKGLYQHDYEGPDDMPAHIKSIITGVNINIPIAKGKLMLGTWQTLWLIEHRTSVHHRNLIITMQGQHKHVQKP